MKKVFLSLILIFSVVVSKAQTLVISNELHDSIVFNGVTYPLLVEDITLSEVEGMFKPDTIKYGIRGNGFVWGNGEIEDKEQIMLICRILEVDKGSRNKSIRKLKKNLKGTVIVLYNVITEEDEYTFIL